MHADAHADLLGVSNHYTYASPSCRTCHSVKCRIGLQSWPSESNNACRSYAGMGLATSHGVHDAANSKPDPKHDRCLGKPLTNRKLSGDPLGHGVLSAVPRVSRDQPLVTPAKDPQPDCWISRANS